MKHFGFPNLFQMAVPEWLIPAFWVGLISAFLLLVGYPFASLAAAMVCGAVIWFGHSRAGTVVFFIIFLALIIVGR